MGDTTKLKIVSITCNSPSENVGSNDFNDEVFLICQSDAGHAQRYPPYSEKLEHPYEDISLVNSMTTGDIWTLTDPELVLEFEYEVLVTLWDRDSTRVPKYDTYLQSNDYQAGTTFTTSLDQQSVTLTNPNGASYTIVSQVVA
jgi:hypothetical protein